MCILRKGAMGQVEQAGNDASISAVLVYRADGLAEKPLADIELAAGIGPAIAGALMDQSKEPDA